MSKYLTSGSPTYTASSRTVALSGGAMSVAIDATDEGRQIFFRSSTSLFNGRIEKFIDANTIRILPSGTLPTIDSTIATMDIYDFGEAHTYQDYMDKIATMIQDGAVGLTTTANGDIDKMVAHAVQIYSKDLPYYVSKKIAGTGSGDYLITTIFGSLWVKDFSYVKEVEFPTGDNPATMLGANTFRLYDDGTAQDGSNLILRFKNERPTTTQYFVAKIQIERKLPRSGVSNFPDTNFHFVNITTLAAAYCCAALAAKYAQSIDRSITVDAVSYDEKTRKYMELAKMYMKQYEGLVFGTSDGDTSNIGAATGEKMYDVNNSAGVPFTFHAPRSS